MIIVGGLRVKVLFICCEGVFPGRDISKLSHFLDFLPLAEVGVNDHKLKVSKKNPRKKYLIYQKDDLSH